MKLVSYNILDGGEGRADPLAETIESQHPDIVVLIEADNPDVLERIGRRLNMDVAFAQGKRHAAAILSRWKISESINHALLRKDFSNCFLETTIIDPLGTPWTVAAVHLHPHASEADETIRLRDVDAILDVFKNLRSSRKPHLLAGDFNSNSPIQQIDPEKSKPRTRQEWKDNGNKLPRRVVQKLLDAGYVDSLQAARGTEAGNIGTFSTQYPGQRVDYIFTHSIDASRIKTAEVVDDRLAKYASDHFPVAIEIV